MRSQAKDLCECHQQESRIRDLSIFPIPLWGDSSPWPKTPYEMGIRVPQRQTVLRIQIKENCTERMIGKDCVNKHIWRHTKSKRRVRVTSSSHCPSAVIDHTGCSSNKILEIFVFKNHIMPWPVWLICFGASSCVPKGWGLNSQSRHISACGFHFQLACVLKAADWCFSHTLMFLSCSLSLSLFPTLSKNNNKEIEKNIKVAKHQTELKKV